MAVFVRTQEIEHEIGATGRFSLRVTSPDVELRAIDGTVARVRIEFEVRAASEAKADELLERVRFGVREDRGELEITEPNRSDGGIGSIARIFGIGTDRIEMSVTAEVPAGATIEYHGVSADLTASGFSGVQQYRTVSGDLVLNDLAGEVGVRGVSSDVSLRAIAPIRIEMNTVSGDISAFAPRFDELLCTTVSGDVEVEGSLAASDAHRVETVSGDLSLGVDGNLALEVRGLSTDVDVNVPHRSEGSRDHRRYVIGDGTARLLFRSMSGDISVRAARRTGTNAPIVSRPPEPPVPPSAPLTADAQLEVLHALERGEIDVDEAGRRLAGGSRNA
jgi:hypothetical protein